MTETEVRPVVDDVYRVPVLLVMATTNRGFLFGSLNPDVKPLADHLGDQHRAHRPFTAEAQALQHAPSC